MSWLHYAVFAAITLASADVCVKLAAGRLSNSLGVLIYGSCTFLFGLSWVLWQWARGGTWHVQAGGVLAAIGVGVSFASVTLGLYLTFGAGVPISVGTPVIRVGGIVLASLVGLFLFEEPVTPRYAAGLLLVCGGLYLVITR